MGTNAHKDLRTKIVQAMMRLDAPTNLYRVMKTTDLAAGTVDYWLDKLEAEGVVVTDVINEQKVYALQPIFYSPEFAKKFDRQLNRLYAFVREQLMLPEGRDREKSAFATMLTILHVITRKHRIS